MDTSIDTAPARSGDDTDDLAALLARHRGLVLKIAASFTTNAADRADLAQDIALQLVRAHSRWDRTRPFTTFAYRVALNVALAQRRSRRATPVPASLDDDGDAASARVHEVVGFGAGDAPRKEPDALAEHDEKLAFVQRAMASLAPIDRALLVLHLEGESQRDIAEVIGTSENNVAVRLTRVRQQLRRLAAKEIDDGTR